MISTIHSVLGTVYVKREIIRATPTNSSDAPSVNFPWWLSVEENILVLKLLPRWIEGPKPKIWVSEHLPYTVLPFT